ncbi:MAG: alpha/beta hydrolase, partial [Hyphomicrobiaceae bacterium]
MTANTDTTYRIKGGRVGVLLIHGLCGTPAEVRFVAQGIARAGYTVHCPMIAGHGRSIWSLKASTWQEWLESMEAALVELRRECDVVICGGLSTGAVLSLMLAARHPDLVQGTALFSPTLWINGWSIPWYARLFKLVRFRWLAGLMDFDDMEPYGIKDDRVREFAYGALQSGDGSMGLVGTPGIALLE